MTVLGTLRYLRRYPVKSMAGHDLEQVFVSFSGLVGDRVFAFVDQSKQNDFPWMTGRQGHDMILFRTRFVGEPGGTAERINPAQHGPEVETPEGERYAVTDPRLKALLERRYQKSLTLRFSERSMQDAAPISLFGLPTVRALGKECGMELDHRRFRANFYADWEREPYFEESLVGRRLRIGEHCLVAMMQRDQRCIMITLDPATGQPSPVVLEKVARNHDGCVGVYGAVLEEGVVRAGDRIALEERAACGRSRCTWATCYNLKVLRSTEDGIDKRFIRTNDRIRAREIRVIDAEGTQIGVMPPFEALKMAREQSLDLVEISATANPPVCRIMDFGKYLYQQEKKEREAKKHQKVIVVKEVKFRINVDDHDYETKKNHVVRFLEEGDKVKATIFFRGREMTRQGLGREILERLVKDLGDKAVVEFRPRQEGNTLHAILAPAKKA